jgi:hypothetical protein
LGLYISRNCVEKLVEILICSVRPGQGTEVRIVLPDLKKITEVMLMLKICSYTDIYYDIRINNLV